MKRLWNTFRYTYAHLRGQILGWGFGLAAYGLMIIPMYDSMAAQKDKLEQMISSYPAEFLAFFGADPTSALSPAGFLGMYAFSMMPVIMGIFAVMVGSGLIANDEERGRLDLIIAHPVGRTAFFFGRVLGLVAAVLSVMFLGWVGFSILLGNSTIGLTWGQMAVPFLSLAVQILVYTALGLVLSMFLPSRGMAGMVTGVTLVSSYVISSLGFMNETLANLAEIMPYHYFQSVMALEELNGGWLSALIGISILMTLVAWWRFVRKDIRLSGEGSWRLPLLSRRKGPAQA